MKVGVRRRLQMVVGLLMLPVSLVPFAVYFRNTPEGRLLWTRATLQFFPPSLPILELGDGHSRSEPGYSGAVAVLVYHGVGSSVDAEGRFSLSVSRFAEQLAAMRAAGMHFVTARDVARARRKHSAPPRNAVMITFDDGRAEAMMLADPLLRDARAKATMFVIADAAADPGIFYASKNALTGYASSRRWDLESHTAGLHDVQNTDLGALPKLTSLAPGETLAGYRERVTEDLDRADRQIAELTGRRPVAFAYPFGAYGGDRTNDVHIRRELRTILAHRYTLGFQQDDQSTVPLTTCADSPLTLRRLDVRPWSGRTLLAHIRAMARRTHFDPRCPGTERPPLALAPRPSSAQAPSAATDPLVGRHSRAATGGASNSRVATGSRLPAARSPKATPTTTTRPSEKPRPTPTTRPPDPPATLPSTTTTTRSPGPPWGKGGKKYTP